MCQFTTANIQSEHCVCHTAVAAIYAIFTSNICYTRNQFKVYFSNFTANVFAMTIFCSIGTIRILICCSLGFVLSQFIINTNSMVEQISICQLDGIFFLLYFFVVVLFSYAHVICDSCKLNANSKHDRINVCHFVLMLENRDLIHREGMGERERYTYLVQCDWGILLSFLLEWFWNASMRKKRFRSKDHPQFGLNHIAFLENFSLTHSPTLCFLSSRKKKRTNVSVSETNPLSEFWSK